MTALGKITYTTSDVDLEAFHRAFDDALATVRRECGAFHPCHVDGQPIEDRQNALEVRSPIDTSLLLGRFAAARPDHVDAAAAAAKRAQPAWGRLPWPERVATMRRAAALIRERKLRLAAIMSLEVGKNRFESMGDAEEAADLIDYYAQQVDDANGFVRPMANLTPTERNVDVLRP
jgi:1-pyrroline-5-carboxylate dehydrogenase